MESILNSDLMEKTHFPRGLVLDGMQKVKGWGGHARQPFLHGCWWGVTTGGAAGRSSVNPWRFLGGRLRGEGGQRGSGAAGWFRAPPSGMEGRGQGRWEPVWGRHQAFRRGVSGRRGRRVRREGVTHTRGGWGSVGGRVVGGVGVADAAGVCGGGERHSAGGYSKGAASRRGWGRGTVG